jgi:secreted trypsin-like serine protease
MLDLSAARKEALMVSHRIRGLIIVTIVGGCGGEPFITEGEAQSAVVGGKVDTTHHSVVALVYQGQAFCSGTLIAPRTVLSAGHCREETGLTAADISVFFGNKVGGSGTSVKAVKWKAHPSYHLDASGIPRNDVSVLVLAEDGPVAPMTWQSSPLPDVVGRSVLMVGYGVTSATKQTGSGTRRQVTSTISDQDGTFLYRGDGKSGTCQGDSGGPTLLGENGKLTVVAVTSYGDETCVALAGSTRVDKYAGFISQLIK